MLSPKVTIDYSKCTAPFDCKKCFQSCAPSVFEVRPVKIERGKETDEKEPGSYRLEVIYRDKCVACMDCVKVCPVNAITVKVPKEVTL